MSKSARYALYAAMDLAAARDTITAGQVAQRHGIPEGALAKVLQALVRAGIAQGTRGAGGGYRLARAANDISVLQVVEVFDPSRPLEPCRVGHEPCQGSNGRRLQRLFEEVDEVSRCTLASVSLETLTR